MPVQNYTPSTEEFTIESLWDDYERRTWHYASAQRTLGRTDPRLLNWIGSIDQSGHTREMCLRQLIANRERGDENRILLRLADWVPQVQAVARDWILEHFGTLPLEAVCANQSLLLYLSRKERLQGDSGLNEITRDLLYRTRSMDRAQFFSFTAMFRRFLFSLSLKNDGHLRPWMLDDPEPFNRLLLLNEFDFTGISQDEMRRLAADKSVFVRRRFFHSQLDAGIKPSENDLLALALDPIRSLRALGQFYLNDIYGEDAYAIYRTKEGKEFFYIADYGRMEDSGLFVDGVRSGWKATQHNCLRALASSAPERLEELDLADLIAQNRRFRSVLLPVLPQVMSLDAILALRPAFEASSPYGTVSFLRLLERKSFWRFVGEGLDLLLTDPPAAMRHFIVRTIQGKVEIYESLSTELRESISAKVLKLRHDSKERNEGLANLLEFTMKTA